MSASSISGYAGTYSTIEYAQNGPPTKTVGSFVPITSDALPTLSKDSFASNSLFPQYQIDNAFVSEIEKAILEANNPLSINDLEEININGIQGLLLNKHVNLNIK